MTSDRAPSRSLSIFKRLVVGALLVLVGFVGWTGFRLWSSWNSVQREPWNGAQVREVLAQEVPPTSTEETVNPASQSEPVADDVFDAYLVVGTGFQGRLADVIMLFLLPQEGQPSIVSIPRDLYLPSPCGGKYMRINANFNGCGDSATGPQLLSLAVEDFTGIEIDHFALFDFDGFERIIDSVGGVTICVDNPVRDFDAWLNLPAGCTEASGAQALAWVRTRKTEEFVNGSWRPVPGQSDLTRHEHQQDVIFQLFDRLKTFSSLGDLTAKVDSLSETFTVDNELSLSSAVSLVWGLRGYEISEFQRLTIPVEGFVTSGGAQVLRPTKPFSEVLREAYPDVQVAAALGP